MPSVSRLVSIPMTEQTFILIHRFFSRNISFIHRRKSNLIVLLRIIRILISQRTQNFRFLIKNLKLRFLIPRYTEPINIERYSRLVRILFSYLSKIIFLDKTPCLDSRGSHNWGWDWCLNSSLHFFTLIFKSINWSNVT